MSDTGNWITSISIAADLVTVLVAMAALWIAIFALRHQRGHDDKVMNHEIRFSEPHVSWSFGGNDGGELIIGLINQGPGAARFVRSCIVLDGNEINNWNWRMVFDAVGQGAVVTIKHPQITLPKFIKSGQTINLVTISIEGQNSAELLHRLIKNVEIHYYYRSTISDDEILAKWSTPQELGFRD